VYTTDIEVVKVLLKIDQKYSKATKKRPPQVRTENGLVGTSGFLSKKDGHIMTQVTQEKQHSVQNTQKRIHNARLNILPQKGVRGICGHIAKSADSYCGNPRCCPWGW